MKVKDQIRSQILEAAADGSRVEKLETQAAILKQLRKELGLEDGAPVVIEGVTITELGRRDNMLLKAIQYAALRWQIHLRPDEAASLFKAVPDNEMMALIPIIIDQHFDDRNFVDPIDEYDVDSVKQLKKDLKGLGFGDIEI